MMRPVNCGRQPLAKLSHEQCFYSGSEAFAAKPEAFGLERHSSGDSLSRLVIESATCVHYDGLRGIRVESPLRSSQFADEYM